MKDRSDDPLHHERTLLPRSYISLPFEKKSIVGRGSYLESLSVSFFILRKPSYQLPENLYPILLCHSALPAYCIRYVFAFNTSSQPMQSISARFHLRFISLFALPTKLHMFCCLYWSRMNTQINCYRNIK